MGDGLPADSTTRGRDESMERIVVYDKREFPEPEPQRSVDDSLFGVAPETDDRPDSVVEGATQDAPQDAGDEAAQDSDDSGEETPQSEDLKVVLSIKGGGAITGVQNLQRARSSRH